MLHVTDITKQLYLSEQISNVSSTVSNTCNTIETSLLNWTICILVPNYIMDMSHPNSMLQYDAALRNNKFDSIIRGSGFKIGCFNSFDDTIQEKQKCIVLMVDTRKEPLIYSFNGMCTLKNLIINNTVFMYTRYLSFFRQW